MKNPEEIIMKFFILSLTIPFSYQISYAQEYTTGYLWRQSTESVIMLQADSAICQEMVGQEFAIDITDGKAGVIIVIQDSPINFFNSTDIGSSQDVHIWIAIQSERDGKTIPVIGAQSTMETMSWFNVLGGTSSDKIIDSFKSSGVFYRSIESLEVNIKPDDVTGGIIFSDDTNLKWQAGKQAGWAKVVGVNHDFYKKDPNGKIICSHVQALLNLKSWAAPGTLEITGDLGLGELLKNGTYQALINAYDPIWIRVNLNAVYD